MPDIALPARCAMPISELHARDPEGSSAPVAFEAVVSTFDHIVRGAFYDRVIRRGAFARSLRDRGLPALVWSHDWDTPPIGRVLDAHETDEGLHVRGELFTDGVSDPLALRVARAMATTQGDGRPTLREFSVGFDIVDAAWEVHDGEEVLAVTDAELYECGPCLVGANRTRLIEVSMSGRGGPIEHDPVLDRFPRPDHEQQRRVRELLTARPR